VQRRYTFVALRKLEAHNSLYRSWSPGYSYTGCVQLTADFEKNAF